MKKLSLFVITLIFVAVSCGSSKKAENDADNNNILPDEDVSDEDAGVDEAEGGEDEEDESIVVNLCDPDPCADFANTDGSCRYKSDGSFECGCAEGYFWGHLGCKKITFANICTGQDKCYYIYSADPEPVCPESYSVFYGQDATYAELGYCLSRDFKLDTSSGYGTTHVNSLLQLEWMQPPAVSTKTWDDASEYCENLNYGGHDDWRLPMPRELLTVVEHIPGFSGQSKQFWTSMSLPGDKTSAWILNGMLYFAGSNKQSKYYFLCTRGAVEPFLESQPNSKQFKVIDVNGSEIVYDLKSGIMWQNRYSKDFDWTDALVYCERSDYAGFSDWRMPNIYELMSLINYKYEYETASEFPLTDKISEEYNPNLWSSTTNTYSDYVVADGINMKTGRHLLLSKEYEEGHVVCIRNDPCRAGLWWNGEECVENPCKDNPCKNLEHSDGICGTEDFKSYYCGCDENYFWDGKECAKNPCEPNPCGDYEHTTGECSAPNRFTFICSCEENLYWWGKEKGCIKEWPHQARVCTGQTKCYDDEKEIECPAEGEEFYGQDAQYAALGFCVPQNYSVDDSYEEEPVVTDINTGLEWQQKVMPADNISWYDVQNYCNKLDYGGYHDWRLPTFYELQTLLSYNSSPTIDAKYFPDTPPENFWSSTITQYGSYDSAYIVNFENADLGEMMMSDFITGETSRLMSSIRCVRGEIFEENHGKVYGVSYEDEKLYMNHTTHLMWNIRNLMYYNGIETWSERMKYCEDLDFAGFSDWRLPNIHELNSISLEDRWLRYGSASTTKAWHPAEHFGEVWYKDDTDPYYVCVRENPCTYGELWENGKCVECATCGCDDGYVWNSDELKCVFKVDRCDPNPCLEVENSTGECIQPGPYEQKCACIEGYSWDGLNDACIEG